jgi:hypothetical protein
MGKMENVQFSTVADGGARAADDRCLVRRRPTDTGEAGGGGGEEDEETCVSLHRRSSSPRHPSGIALHRSSPSPAPSPAVPSTAPSLSYYHRVTPTACTRHPLSDTPSPSVGSFGFLASSPSVSCARRPVMPTDARTDLAIGSDVCAYAAQDGEAVGGTSVSKRLRHVRRSPYRPCRSGGGARRGEPGGGRRENGTSASTSGRQVAHFRRVAAPRIAPVACAERKRHARIDGGRGRGRGGKDGRDGPKRPPESSLRSTPGTTVYPP